MTVSAYKYMLVYWRIYIWMYRLNICISVKELILLSLYLRLFKEPRNRFPAWRVGNDNPTYRTGPPGYIGWRIEFSESIPSGLHKRLQIRVHYSAKNVRTKYILRAK